MKSNYEPIGKHIQLVDYRNSEEVTSTVLGISIDKEFTITADFFHADNEIHSLPDQVCKSIKTFVTTVCHKDGIITILMKTIRSVQ